jgi:SAM-dependent methyltransferase
MILELLIYTIVMDWLEQNTKVYDEYANEFSKYFGTIGSRIGDIERGLKLAGNPSNAKVFEIGCGDGRDAEEIVKRVGYYEGIDPSKGLLGIAKKLVPDGKFVLADAVSYDFPNKKLDVIFAFASLLHLDKDDVYEIFQKANRSLRPGGIFYISLKERKEYIEEISSLYGTERMFYYYNPEIIKHVAGKSFKSVYVRHQKQGKTDWFTIALRKIVQ